MRPVLEGEALSRASGTQTSLKNSHFDFFFVFFFAVPSLFFKGVVEEFGKGGGRRNIDVLKTQLAERLDV